MSNTSETQEKKAIEVFLIPESKLLEDVGDIDKIKMSQGCSLLGCLGRQGSLVVGDVADSDALGTKLEGSYSDFAWEEVTLGEVVCSRLLAVNSQCAVRLMKVEAESSGSINLVYLSECPAESLLQMVKDRDISVSELLSLKLLSFQDSCCVLLLNASHVLVVHVRPQTQAVVELQEDMHVMPSHVLRLANEVQEGSCFCFSAGVLFLLGRDGVLYGYDMEAGSLLASVHLPAYLSSVWEDHASSFCLLQVSADLSTAVVLSHTPSRHTALTVDLNHCFRWDQDLQLSAEAPDQTCRSAWDRVAPGPSFSMDRSWEARLASMYSAARGSSQAPVPSQPLPQLVGSPWFSALPRVASRLPLSKTQMSTSSAPAGGGVTTFCVPASSVPSLLSVSQFSALMTFTSPDQGQTSVVLWDLGSQCVSYHRCERRAAVVEWSGAPHSALLITRGAESTGSALSQVMFGVDQQQLLGRLMVFGKAATVDVLCHLNSWGRCSVPIHSLQAGLKNRQLDTVDLFLKSKDKLLSQGAEPPKLLAQGAEPPVSSLILAQGAEPPISSLTLLQRVQEVRPALDLLCSSIREGHAEVQSRQFSEQLLRITLTFLNSQLRLVCCNKPELDAELQKCVSILNGYVYQLWRLMRRFPGSNRDQDLNQTSRNQAELSSHQDQEWDLLTSEEVVRQAVLSGQVPRAQAYLRSQCRPGQTLQELQRVGLHHALSCLAQRQLPFAITLLRNMGFNVKEVLRSVCLYTDQKELRDFVVEQLSRKGCFSEEDSQTVKFFSQLEQLGSMAASRFTHPQVSVIVLESTQSETCRDKALLQLDQESGQARLQGGPELWSCLRLDWIRHWDHCAQTMVLLSRLQDNVVSSCSADTLWLYLTALHLQPRLSVWIQDAGDASTPCWPELTPELLSNNTVCSGYMRELLLNLLARKGLFIQTERCDLELLMYRLAQTEGVMAATVPPGLDLHADVITHCLQNNLQYLLYTYLEHYRITPRNVPILGGRNVYESQPWFDMLVKVQEITMDLSDPERLFQASLTSAQVLVPGGQASLSSLLLEGHGVVAMATLMFSPGGVDQVVSRGERPYRPASKLDPQLLKMALGPYPKLRAALFPASGPPDTSIYSLMQSLHPLDPSRLFGWQAASSLLYTETSDLPHFASAHLVNKYAQVEKLDFLFYLRHSRPSFAYAAVLQELSGAEHIQSLVQHMVLQASSLALRCFLQTSVAAACLVFCQLLGASTLKLRVDLRVLVQLLQHWSQKYNTGLEPHIHTLVNKGDGLVEAEPGVAEDLIGHLEEALMDSLEQRGIQRSSYEAGQEWSVPVQFCQLHSLALSSVYPAHCAADGQWLHFLLFVQLHGFPPNQVMTLASQFGPTLQGHLSLAFEDLHVQSPWGGPDILAQGPVIELLQVVLLSQEKRNPWKQLLGEALEQHCPTLSVLAACTQGAELLQCLCVWVVTSVDDVTAAEATAHLQEAARHHPWTLHDLSIIWKTALGRGQVKALLQGFQLFHKESPLLLLLEVFDLCCEYRNFSAARDKLLHFQRILLTLRSSGAEMEGGVPVVWLESQASVLLMVLFQRSSDHFHLQRLLQLLQNTEPHLQANGVDLLHVGQISAVLQGSSVGLPVALLGPSSPQVLQAEYLVLLDQLQARGLLCQAQRVAQLAGIPGDALLINQLQQDVQSQKAKQRWGRREVRVVFWKRCHQQFLTNSSDPESVCRFFLEQAGSCLSQTELLGAQEHCLLLGLAGHWLSLVEPQPLLRLEALEKEQWCSRLHQHLLLVASETEKESDLCLPAASSDTSSYEAMLEDFSFSKISALNQDSCLSLSGLPGPEDQNADPLLGPDQRGILTHLIGQLLDEGRIHEASRVCRYFSIYQQDMWLVLRSRGLATGELNPQQQEVVLEPMTSVPNSPSSGSLSSFVMLPLPDDHVLTQLQMLVDQCRHGNNYCRQVLSLYQLSKDLPCSFLELCSEAPQTVLGRLLSCSHPERYKRAEAFIRAQGLSPDTVAHFLSTTVLQRLQAAEHDHMFEDTQVLRLCADPSLLGCHLLDNIRTLRVNQVSSSVELLVLAHACFSLSCDMEGIVRVLHAARHLSHAHLAPGQHFSLLVRLLTGIGRYDEMTYIFDLLHQNHRFEILLRKKMDTHTSCSLKTALLDYIKRCLPCDSEKYNMVALCFSMRREIGENHEMAALTQLKILHSQPWHLIGSLSPAVVTPDLKNSLTKVLALLKDAAESYSKDECLRQASRCIKMAKLVLLQRHLLNHGSDQRLINLQPGEMSSTMVALPRCYQVFVLSEAYDHVPDWAEILYCKVVLNGDFFYLEELKSYCVLTASLFEEISKKFRMKESGSGARQNLKRLLGHCEDVVTQYRLTQTPLS